MTSSSIIVDCAPLKASDLAAVDGLARLQLAARRRGCRLELREVEQSLRELIGLVGLAETLGVEP